MKKIYTNTGKQKEFQKDVADVRDRCNNLIEVYETFQSWQRINTLQDFIELVTDPKNYFDETILQNIEVKNVGTSRPVPSVLAQMFGVQYNEYLNLVAGLPISDPDCVPCGRFKTRKGAKAISLFEYEDYADFLLFESRFDLNTLAISKHLNTFEVNAETPAQIELYNYYINLTETLNEAIARHKIGLANINDLAKIFGLQVLNNKLVINSIALSELIKFTK
jgi:hypothetical protein